jgi:hypothetical protein
MPKKRHLEIWPTNHAADRSAFERIYQVPLDDPQTWKRDSSPGARALYGEMDKALTGWA